MARIRNISLAIVLGLTIAIAKAEATPVTYDFSLTATSGPLSGSTANGTFTYDTSSIVPGGTNNATGLLTALNLTWHGISYNQTTANTGFLIFDAKGTLDSGAFGTNCGPGVCRVAFGQESWFVGSLLSEFSYNTTTGFGGGSATLRLATVAPEPSTLALLGVGLAVLLMLAGITRRSRALVDATPLLRLPPKRPAVGACAPRKRPGRERACWPADGKPQEAVVSVFGALAALPLAVRDCETDQPDT